MRILELYLKAFGPFTEKRLVFEAGDPGLCVIHGSNEAGKSSALRAIHDLLYGIHPQSPDDFVHRYADMRVGARLLFSDGEELAFVRKKGAKNTLRDFESEAPIEAGRLNELTQLVPEALFQRFYGLDHEELSGGSRALLEDDGELGHSLYSAGLGAGNIRAILSDLEKEAEELFTPRGKKKPRINERIAELGKIRSRIKQEALRPQEWQEAEQAEQAAGERLAGLEEELAERRRELSRLERVRRTLRPLAQRRRSLARQEALTEVPVLGADFGERLRSLRELRRRAEDEREAALERRRDLEARREGLALHPEILEERESIARLQALRGATRKEEADLPRREAELARLQEEHDVRLAALDPRGEPGTIERLREAMGRGRQIQELGGDHSARDESLATALEAVERASERLERLDRELAETAAPVEAVRLRVAVQEAERLGPIDARVTEREDELRAIEGELDRAFASLGLWAGSEEDLERAVIPDSVALERFEAAEVALERRMERLAQSEEESSEARRRVAEELSTLRGERAVPSEGDLAGARRERDTLWQRIRPAIESDRLGSSVGAGDPQLADSFESSMGRADETVDRLRREADRVARQAALVARSESLEAEAEANRKARKSLEEALTSHRQDWISLWSAVDLEPTRPAEMIAWRRRLEKWLDLAEQRRIIDVRLARESAVRKEARQGLRGALEELGAGASPDFDDRLASILGPARELLAQLDEEAERQRRLTVERASSEHDREQAIRDHRRSEARLARWRDEWRVAVEGLCFTKEPRPSEALDRLDAARELFDVLRERDQLCDRIEKMKGDIDLFEAELASFLARVAPDLEGQGTSDQRISALDTRLRDAQRTEDLRQELDQSLAEWAERLSEADRNLRSASQQMTELCQQAGTDAEADLDSTLRAWEISVEIRREQRLAEEQLADSGDGLSTEQLEAEAEAVDPDTLAGRIAVLAEQIEVLARDRDRVRDELRSAQDGLQRMDGGAEVAALAASAEEVQAAIRNDVDRYIVLRLSREILDREIESYRREHQDPVLARARVIFSRLTLGAYGTLQVDHDDAGRAQLVALGANGREVRVDAMSSGTRDQLFLALRLATLEDSLERSESMPLISDDILVHFDDDRSLATLDVLATLGERMQVLLFTHHTRVRDQARSLGTRARVLELAAQA